MWVQSLGWEDPLEVGMATPSSVLTWRIPWTEEPGRLESVGLQRVGHDGRDWERTQQLQWCSQLVILNFWWLATVLLIIKALVSFAQLLQPPLHYTFVSSSWAKCNVEVASCRHCFMTHFELKEDRSNLFFCLPSFPSVQLLICVWFFVTPWTVTCQASLSITNSWSLLKLMSIQSVMPSNHLI